MSKFNENILCGNIPCGPPEVNNELLIAKDRISQLESEKAELQRVVKVKDEALKKIQWNGELGDWDESGCFECGRHKNEGHTEECPIGKAVDLNSENTGQIQAMGNVVKAAENLEDWLAKNVGDNDEWPLQLKTDEESSSKLASLLQDLSKAILLNKSPFQKYISEDEYLKLQEKYIEQGNKLIEANHELLKVNIKLRAYEMPAAEWMTEFFNVKEELEFFKKALSNNLNQFNLLKSHAEAMAKVIQDFQWGSEGLCPGCWNSDSYGTKDHTKYCEFIGPLKEYRRDFHEGDA